MDGDKVLTSQLVRAPRGDCTFLASQTTVVTNRPFTIGRADCYGKFFCSSLTVFVACLGFRSQRLFAVRAPGWAVCSTGGPDDENAEAQVGNIVKQTPESAALI